MVVGSNSEKRVIHLFHLPPCRPSLNLHARINNYAAKIWRQADQKIKVYESPQQHGWNENYPLEWVNETFATDIAKHQDTKDVRCDNDTTNSDDEDGLK